MADALKPDGGDLETHYRYTLKELGKREGCGVLMDARYLEQVRLLLRWLPALSAADCFALKGGTAIDPPAMSKS